MTGISPKSDYSLVERESGEQTEILLFGQQ